jgi:hypothetical protein
VTSESFVYECALYVLFKGYREDGRGHDSCGDFQVQRRGDREHAAETNTQFSRLSHPVVHTPPLTIILALALILNKLQKLNILGIFKKKLTSDIHGKLTFM